MAGRKPEFIRFPEKKAILLDAIAASLPYELACMQAGISRSAFYDWKALGEQGKQPYADFLDELNAREAEAVYLMHQELRAAGAAGDTKATIFLLKARYPQHYSETVRQEHTGDGGGPLRVEHGTTTGVIADPGLRALAAELVARASSGASDPGELCAEDVGGPVADGATPPPAE